MAEHGDPHVLLDVSHAPAAEVLAHFPNIAAHCASAGVDITHEPIPVAPAQHYMCGGVQVGPDVSQMSYPKCTVQQCKSCLKGSAYQTFSTWHGSAPKTEAQIPSLFMS